jgi:ribose-phosphate pyrophosphokinase
MLWFEEIFEVRKYPAGEPHVVLRPGTITAFPSSVMCANVRDWNDLVVLVIADDIMRRNFAGRAPQWVIPYFPFSRHDRRNDKKDSCPLHFALKLVEGLDITTIDPHSDVSAQLNHIPQSMVVRQAVYSGILQNIHHVIIPDAGASKKAYSWLRMFHDVNVLQGLKHRDPATGALSGFELVGDITHLHEGTILVVDDICDGGGTFIGLMEEIPWTEYRANLLVTHGLFTKGVDELKKTFDKIITLDVYRQEGVETLSTNLIAQNGLI